eukprot:gene6815-30787_t
MKMKMRMKPKAKDGRKSGTMDSAFVLDDGADFWSRVAATAVTQREQQQDLGDVAVLVVGDLHGDMKHALEALQLVGATDKSGKWKAGNSVLVQMGDIVDRGHFSLQLIDLFEDLKVSCHGHGHGHGQGEWYASRMELKRLARLNEAAAAKSEDPATPIALNINQAILDAMGS